MKPALRARTDVSLMPGAVSFVPAMSDTAIAAVREFESNLRQYEQAPFVTQHLIHAGMYCRTVTLPKGAVITGALVKRATALIVNGDATVAIGYGESVRLTGYHVLPASAHRKQAFVAHAQTQLTMIFATDAQDVRAAEDEFTDEGDLLQSRGGENIVTITGEHT